MKYVLAGTVCLSIIICLILFELAFIFGTFNNKPDVHANHLSTNEFVLEKGQTFDDKQIYILKDCDTQKEFIVIESSKGIAITDK